MTPLRLPFMLLTLGFLTCVSFPQGDDAVAVYKVEPIAAEHVKGHLLSASFYKKVTTVQGIVIATSENVSDLAHMEAAYQFDRVMQSIKPEIAQRIRECKVLCLLIGHKELTSDLPQFQSELKGKELDFYNWRQRGFLTERLGQTIVVFAEEDVLEYKGGMQLESILIHEFGHVIHGAGFDDALQERLTEVYHEAKRKGLWMDGRAAQRFRRVESTEPVKLLDTLTNFFPDESPEMMAKYLDGGDILVNGKPSSSDVMVTKDDEVLIVFGGDKECYAHKNRAEYWAEGVQCWYDTNRTMDHDHNHIHTRSQLKEYDPGLAKLCEDVLSDGEWRFVSPRERAGTGHLADFDPETSPEVEKLDHIKAAANDYYDEYWQGYWPRLRAKYGVADVPPEKD